MEYNTVTNNPQTNYQAIRNNQPTNRLTQIVNRIFEQIQGWMPRNDFPNQNLRQSTGLQAENSTTNRLTQIVNGVFVRYFNREHYQAWISQNVYANPQFISLRMFTNGEPLLLRRLALSRPASSINSGGGGGNYQLQLQAMEPPFRSYASQLMTIVTTWRNLDGKEENWTSGGKPFWEERRAIPLSFYAKAIAAEICFPVITTIAVVESIAYKSIALLGKFFGRVHIRNDYEQLFQSSSFTTLWSLADMAVFNANTNVYTHEALARLAAKGMGYNFFRPIDAADLYTTFGPHFTGPRIKEESNNNNNNNSPDQMPTRDADLFRAVTEVIKSTDDIIKLGSIFLQNLLKNERAETIESCQNVMTEAIKFVLFKTVHHLAVEDKSAPIPDFLRAETKSEISKLRADETFQSEVASGNISLYLTMTPEEYDDEKELPPYLEKITRAWGLEYQNKIFFDCFAACLKTLPKS